MHLQIKVCARSNNSNRASDAFANKSARALTNSKSERRRITINKVHTRSHKAKLLAIKTELNDALNYALCHKPKGIRCVRAQLIRIQI